jgi:hypothetical protein
MTNRALTARLQQRDTGRLRVGRGASELRVGLMDGEIVSATCRDDLRHLLRRLLLAGTIQPAQIDEIIHLDQSGTPALAVLLDLTPEPTLAAILHDRFIENLIRFLGSAANPRFTHLPTIFDDGFQIGLDPHALLQSCADAWDDAMSIDLATTVFRGPSPARNDLQREVLDRIGGGATVSGLLVQLPSEPFTARALLARMLRARVLDTVEGTEPDTATDELPIDFARVLGSVPQRGGDPTTPKEWRPEADTPVSVGALLRGRPAPGPGDHARTDRLPSPDPAAEALEDLDDPPTDGSRSPSAAPPLRPGALEHLRNPQDWIHPNVEIDEDLDIFEDHEDNRGGADAEAGAFATEAHNLDRVEIAAIEPEPELEPIEIDEGPSNRFSAPVLSDRDARAKIEVASSVVASLSAALDQVEGRGRGQAAVQLLFEGSPATFKPLFVSLTAPDDGSLPTAALLRNLAHRPATEHRRLINEGLVNLIERYLSVAVEELPDEAIDQVLEDMAGYRQRMGL